MDISYLGDIELRLVTARVVESHAVRGLTTPGRKQISISQHSDTEIQVPEEDGLPIRVVVKHTAREVNADEKAAPDTPLLALLTYIAEYSYVGTAKEISLALQNPYLQYVVLAQVYPLAMQSWLRLMHSIGTSPTSSAQLGLHISRRLVEQGIEASDVQATGASRPA